MKITRRSGFIAALLAPVAALFCKTAPSGGSAAGVAAGKQAGFADALLDEGVLSPADARRLGMGDVGMRGDPGVSGNMGVSACGDAMTYAQELAKAYGTREATIYYGAAVPATNQPGESGDLYILIRPPRSPVVYQRQPRRWTAITDE